MHKKSWVFVFVALLVSSLACSVFSGGSPKAPAPATPQSGGSVKSTEAPPVATSTVAVPTSAPSGGADSYNTEFPLPDNISNFTELGNGSINFQTKMSLKDTIAFYRAAFAKAGYKEREINTAITDGTFSLVFDGHASGKAIVIQGVDLGGSTNVNIRFEDV